MNKLRIWWLKRKLKAVCLEMYDLQTLMDCGNDLVDVITGGKLSALRRQRDVLADRLRAIDPNFPKAKA